MQVLQKQEKTPDIELLPAPSKPTKKVKRTHVPSSPATTAPRDRPPFRKIKIVCSPIPSPKAKPVYSNQQILLKSPLPESASGEVVYRGRRTKSVPIGGPIKKKVNPGMNFNIGANLNFTKGKDLFRKKVTSGDLYRGQRVGPGSTTLQNHRVSSHFDMSQMEDDPFALQNKDAKRDFLKEKLRGYLCEENCQASYVLEDHTVMFLKNFVSDKFINSPSVRNRVEKILKGIQDTIPDNPVKRLAIKNSRSKLADIIDQPDYAKVYTLDDEAVRFMEAFAFGVANPCQREVEKAEEILRVVEVRGLRNVLINLTTTHAPVVHSFDLSTRIFIDNFVSRVRPDKMHLTDLTKLKQIIKQLKETKSSNPIAEHCQDIESTSSKEPDTKSSYEKQKELLMNDTINESDLSSPEIMRSYNEDCSTIISPPDLSISSQPCADLICPEVILDDTDGETHDGIPTNDLNHSECSDAEGKEVSSSSFCKFADLGIIGLVKNTAPITNENTSEECEDVDDSSIRFYVKSCELKDDDFLSFCSVFSDKLKDLVNDLIESKAFEKETLASHSEYFDSIFKTYSHPVLSMIAAFGVFSKLRLHKKRKLRCTKISDFIKGQESVIVPLIQTNFAEDMFSDWRKVPSIYRRFCCAIDNVIDDFLKKKSSNLVDYLRVRVRNSSAFVEMSVSERSLIYRLFYMILGSKTLPMVTKRMTDLKRTLMLLEKYTFDLDPIFQSREICKQRLLEKVCEGELAPTVEGNHTDVDISMLVTEEHLSSLRSFMRQTMTDIKFVEKINVNQTIFLRNFVDGHLLNMSGEMQYHHTMDILNQVFEKSDKDKEDGKKDSAGNKDNEDGKKDSAGNKDNEDGKKDSAGNKDNEDGKKDSAGEKDKEEGKKNSTGEKGKEGGKNNSASKTSAQEKSDLNELGAYAANCGSQKYRMIIVQKKSPGQTEDLPQPNAATQPNVSIQYIKGVIGTTVITLPKSGPNKPKSGLNEGKSGTTSDKSGTSEDKTSDPSQNMVDLGTFDFGTDSTNLSEMGKNTPVTIIINNSNNLISLLVDYS